MAIKEKCIIGVDIGGSKINAIVFNDGKVLKNAKILTPKRSQKKFLEELETLVAKLISDINKKEILGIGCGVAGVLDLKNEVVLKSPNLKILDGFNIKNWLSKKFNCEIKIDNDARCFTRAEYLFGSGRGYKNIVGITLGTGIGGGIVVQGKIFYGANGSAGEIGHMIIDHGQDLECLTVKYLRKIGKTNASLKNFEINFAVGIANIINILDPQAIIIGGGALEAIGFSIPEIKILIKNLVVSPKSYRNVKILKGKLGDNTGAIGAAAIFLEQASKTI